MKLIILLSMFTISSNSWALNLTKKLQVIQINYNEKSKAYDVSFEVMAGIYRANKSHLSCLEKSIDKKIEVKIEYEAIGLKILNCY